MCDEHYIKCNQGLSQDLETGCLKLVVVKILGDRNNSGLAVSSEGRFLPWKNLVSSILEEICFFHFFHCFWKKPISSSFL